MSGFLLCPGSSIAVSRFLLCPGSSIAVSRFLLCPGSSIAYYDVYITAFSCGLFAVSSFLLCPGSSTAYCSCDNYEIISGPALPHEWTKGALKLFCDDVGQC